MRVALFLSLCFCICFKSFHPASATNILKIAAMNLQTFGTRKMLKPGVPDILTQIVNRYDVIALLEIRDKTNTAFPQFMDLLKANTKNNNWNFYLSKRLGLTPRHQEQYAFVFRSDLVDLIKVYQYPDPNEKFARDPTIAHFKPRTPGGKPFNYLAIHAKPLHPQTAVELDGLVDVVESIPSCFGEKTVIGGDFNTACPYVRKKDMSKIRLFNDIRFTRLLDENVDTTVGYSSCNLDNFVVSGEGMASRCHNPKVFNFASEYGLTHDKALLVSDHYPIDFELEV